jgi:hypothetical protein
MLFINNRALRENGKNGGINYGRESALMFF